MITLLGYGCSYPCFLPVSLCSLIGCVVSSSSSASQFLSLVMRENTFLPVSLCSFSGCVVSSSFSASQFLSLVIRENSFCIGFIMKYRYTIWFISFFSGFIVLFQRLCGFFFIVCISLSGYARKIIGFIMK